VRRVVISVIALAIATLPASAKKPSPPPPLPKPIALAIHRLVGEFIDCGIFYSMAHSSLEWSTTSANVARERYEKASKQMFGFAANAAAQIDLKEAALQAQVVQLKKRQLDVISGNIANFAVLAERYDKICTELKRDPGDRLRALTLEANTNLAKQR